MHCQTWSGSCYYALLGSPFPSKSCLRVRSSMKAEPYWWTWVTDQGYYDNAKEMLNLFGEECIVMCLMEFPWVGMLPHHDRIAHYVDWMQSSIWTQYNFNVLIKTGIFSTKRLTLHMRCMASSGPGSELFAGLFMFTPLGRWRWRNHEQVNT